MNFSCAHINTCSRISWSLWDWNMSHYCKVPRSAVHRDVLSYNDDYYFFSEMNFRSWEWKEHKLKKLNGWSNKLEISRRMGRTHWGDIKEWWVYEHCVAGDHRGRFFANCDVMNVLWKLSGPVDFCVNKFYLVDFMKSKNSGGFKSNTGLINVQNDYKFGINSRVLIQTTASVYSN